MSCVGDCSKNSKGSCSCVNNDFRQLEVSSSSFHRPTFIKWLEKRMLAVEYAPKKMDFDMR